MEGMVMHGGRDWQKLIRTPSSYDDLICADVNDAFYPPAPQVLETLTAWRHTVNHSPDTLCGRLTSNLAEQFDVPFESIAVGSGSSELLHSIIPVLIRTGDEVVLQDPTYGEYARSV